MSRLQLDSMADNLVQANDGIWHARDDQSVSYPEDGHDKCFAVEDGSFWFEHRNACIQALVSRFSAAGDANPIFDIGGGNGFVSLGLQHAGYSTVLVEPGVSGVRNAKLRGVENIVQATTETAGFRIGSLANVGLFDVIEHIEDDVAFLQSMRQLMQPESMLYATVPAYQWLWSQKDIHAGHFRRYTLSNFTKLLYATGFEIAYASYFFRPLPLPILLAKAIPYRLGLGQKRQRSIKDVSRDHADRTSLRARLASRLLHGEIENIREGVPMGFGGSILVAARTTHSQITGSDSSSQEQQVGM